MENSVRETCDKQSNGTHLKQCSKQLRLNKSYNTFKTVHEALTYQTIMQNTFETVRKTLTQIKILQNTFKTVHRPPTYQTIIQNTENSAQATDLTYNQTEHIQNGVRRANVKKTKLNIFKTVRKTLT